MHMSHTAFYITKESSFLLSLQENAIDGYIKITRKGLFDNIENKYGKMFHTSKTSGYDQNMPQSHTTDQPTPPPRRDTKH